jgi:hypothetical protein
MGLWTTPTTTQTHTIPRTDDDGFTSPLKWALDFCAFGLKLECCPAVTVISGMK